MQYEVKLRLHEDSNGIWGLTHFDTVGQFDAFYSADGIFHDVFEHYFEHTHKYFRGKAANTVWGEMVASGHAVAYADMGLNSFMYRDRQSIRNYTTDTITLFEDYIHGHIDYMNYSHAREDCHVPRQSFEYLGKGNHVLLRLTVNEYLEWRSSHLSKGRDRLKEIPEEYIKRCYIYGYKQGMKLIEHDKDHAFEIMHKFLEQWNDITSSHSSDQLFDKPVLSIEDENAYDVKGFRFVVNSYPKLSVRQFIIDEVDNEYPIDLLYCG